MNITKMEILPRPVIVKGRLIYSEAMRSSSVIRLKKQVLDHFPQLKSGKWDYQLEYWRNNETTIQRLKEAQENKEVVPLLIFIHSAGEDSNEAGN